MKNKNVKSYSSLALLPIFAASLVACGGSSPQTETLVAPIDTTVPTSGWEMVWSDEFDGDSLDLNSWTFEINCEGGGNQERQCYTDSPDNLFLSDGMLNIVARQAEAGAPLPYTSSRINSSGKFDFTYGRVEMRAKLPSGQGSWPAFWMMPTDFRYGGWPKSGEIDIMEAVNLGTVGEDGVAENRVFGTLHYGNDFPNNVFSGKDYRPPNDLQPADDFNTYAIEWQEGEIRWYMNGHLYAMQRQSEVRVNSQGESIGLIHRGWFVPQFNPISGEMENLYTEAPFDQNFHLILNQAVGGNFPENTNLGGVDASAFENGQNFQVDYVRVYQCSQDPQTGKGCETLRAGYDDPEDAFVEGVAPTPTLPTPDVAIPITIFEDTVADGWALWDCCGGTIPEVVMDDEPFGAVAEFRINDNNGTVLGFNSRDGGQPYNASAMIGVGSLSFDMKVVNATTSPTTWLLKVEADNNTSFAEVALNTSLEGRDPEEGEWQRYTFPIQTLSDLGLDVSAIDIIMIFPAWQTGEGAVYRVDNLKIEADTAAPSVELVLFEDAQNPNWPLWDCCGGTTPSEVFDSDEFGMVAEFQINDNNGTVLGFDGRNGGAPFDASSLLAEGVFRFDMKLVSPTASETTWLLKIEGQTPDVFAELPLSASNEGAEPSVGEWQSFTFDMSALADAGLDVSQISVVMVFPTWQTGAGAVYRIDNAKFFNPNASGSAPSGPLVEIFADEINEGWPLWDCCGGTTPTVEMDDPEFGAVAEFRINDNNGTVLGFYSRDTGTPFDASSILTTGVFRFDMKVVSPTAAETTWLMKIESGGNTSFAELPLSASQEGATPEVGEWQSYTFDLLTLSDAGLDLSAIDVVMVFPAWQTGAGAVYRIDNVYIGNPSDIDGSGSGGSGGNPGMDNADLVLFADQVNDMWPLWDCCGGTTPTVEPDDAEHGSTAEFRINDNNGTVLGFYSRDAGQPYNAESILTTGKFQFEMKIVAPTAGETTWLMKLEANGNTSFVELPLSASNEGAEPVVGEWQTYTFDLITLADAGLDVTGIDVVMVFPLWQTGAGAVYRLDNVVFLKD